MSTNDVSGWRETVDRVFAYLAALFFVAVLVQVFLAGVGVFGDHASKVEDASSFDPHRTLGGILGIVGIVLFLLAIAARISRAVVVESLVLALLAVAAQPALSSGGNSDKWVGGLHALDGILILLLSGWLTGAAHRREAARRRSAGAVPSPAAPSS